MRKLIVTAALTLMLIGTADAHHPAAAGAGLFGKGGFFGGLSGGKSSVGAWPVGGLFVVIIGAMIYDESKIPPGCARIERHIRLGYRPLCKWSKWRLPPKELGRSVVSVRG